MSVNLFPTQTPVSTSGSTSVCLGTQFSTSLAGQITGLRFWSETTTGSVPIGLWNASGTLLASGTITVTATGWQTLTLGTAVPINSGVTYTVGYCRAGTAVLPVTANALPISNDPLTASHSVTASSSTLVEPTGSPGPNNFFADIVFTPAATTPAAAATTRAARGFTAAASAVFVVNASAVTARAARAFTAAARGVYPAVLAAARTVRGFTGNAGLIKLATPWTADISQSFTRADRSFSLVSHADPPVVPTPAQSTLG